MWIRGTVSGPFWLACALAGGDIGAWSTIARSARRALRRNISPRLIATPEEIHAVTCDELQRNRDLPGFILGTGVIPFGTPTERIAAVRQARRKPGPP